MVTIKRYLCTLLSILSLGVPIDHLLYGRSARRTAASIAGGIVGAWLLYRYVFHPSSKQKTKENHDQHQLRMIKSVSGGSVIGLVIYALLSNNDGQLKSAGLSHQREPRLEGPQPMPSSSIWQKSLTQRGSKFNAFMDDNKRFEHLNRYVPIHKEGTGILRLMTYNVYMPNRFGIDQGHHNVLQVIAETNPDVLCIQEFTPHFCSTVTNELNKRYPYSCYVEPSDLRFGNAIYSRYPFSIAPRNIVYKTSNTEPRGYNATAIRINQQVSFTLMNTHLDVYDHTERIRLGQVQELISDPAALGNNVMLCGDFNSVRRADYTPDVWQAVKNDACGRIGLSELPTSVLDYLKRVGFTDSFSFKGVPGPKFTVWNGTTIDFIMLKNWQIPLAGCYVYYMPYASDHLPVIVDLKVSDVISSLT